MILGKAADTVSGNTASTRATREENYKCALDIFMRLQKRKALPEYDLKYLEDLRAALLKLEQG